MKNKLKDEKLNTENENLRKEEKRQKLFCFIVRKYYLLIKLDSFL